MPDQKEVLNQTNLALAALAAGIVRTLCESDPSFEIRLDRHMEQVYTQVKNSSVSTVGALETMKWFRALWKS